MTWRRNLYLQINKAVMCVRFSVSLSDGSREQGLKPAPERSYHAVRDDEKRTLTLTF